MSRSQKALAWGARNGVLNTLTPIDVSTESRPGAYLPTEGTNVPDYLVAAGTSLPDVQVCYGLTCQGQFAKMARFEAKNEAGAVTLTQLAEVALEIAVAMSKIVRRDGLFWPPFNKPM